MPGLDSGFPKADAVRKTSSVTRSWKQRQKEISIVFVKRSKSFGNDFNELARISSCGCAGAPTRPVDRLHCRRQTCPRHRRATQEALQIVGHVSGSCVPIRRPAGERFETNTLKLLRYGVVDLAQRLRIS